MNSIQLSNKISLVDDKFIFEAEKSTALKQSYKWQKFVALAACITIIIGLAITILKLSHIKTDQKDIDTLFNKYFPVGENISSNPASIDLYTWKQVMEHKDYFWYSQLLEVEIISRSNENYALYSNGPTAYFNAKVIKCYFGTLKEGDNILIAQSIGDLNFKIPNFPLFEKGEKFITLFGSYSEMYSRLEKINRIGEFEKLDWDFYIIVTAQTIGYIDEINGEEYVRIDNPYEGDGHLIDELMKQGIIKDDNEVLRFEKENNKLTYVKKDAFETFIAKKSEYEKVYEAKYK